MPVIGLLLIPLLILFLVLWVWMLIDCLKRPDDKFAYDGNNAKLIWVLVIIFTGLIGALIYYFLIKKTGEEKKRDRMKNMIKSTTAAKTKDRGLVRSWKSEAKYLKGELT